MNDFSNRLRKEDWEVRDVDIEVARRIIRAFHYAKGTANTAVHVHGLFRKNEFWDENCMGVAWWMPPIKAAALATYPKDWTKVLALSRLVVNPEVPKNACTFLLSRSVKMIDRKIWPCLVTYASSWRGHTGGIYRAAGWTYLGLTKPESVFVRNGTLICRKSASNTRTRDEMTALGAVDQGKFAKHKFTLIADD